MAIGTLQPGQPFTMRVPAEEETLYQAKKLGMNSTAAARIPTSVATKEGYGNESFVQQPLVAYTHSCDRQAGR